MKRLILFIGIIGLVVVSQAQSSSSVWFAPSVVSVDSASWEQEFKDAYYYWDVPPSLDTCVFINAYIDSLKSYGYWQRADLWYLFANKNPQASLTNLISPGTHDAVAIDAPLHTVYEGYTGDGSADHLTTYNPSSENTNFALNSASIGVYLRINQQEDSYLYGADDSDTHFIRFRPRSTAPDVANAIMNAATTQSSPGTITDGSGWWMNSRTGANAVEMYRNGGTIDTEADASSQIPNDELDVLRQTSTYSTNQVSIFVVMDGTSDNANDTINILTEQLADLIGFGIQ